MLFQWSWWLNWAGFWLEDWSSCGSFMEISRSSVWGLELVADRSGCRYYVELVFIEACAGWYGSMDPLSQVVEGEVLVFKSGVLWASFFVRATESVRLIVMIFGVLEYGVKDDF
ncbi:hypothetical protein YC2023_109688 [Brassica napus]